MANPHTDDRNQPCDYCKSGEPVTEPEGRPMCAECHTDYLEWRAAESLAEHYEGGGR